MSHQNMSPRNRLRKCPDMNPQYHLQVSLLCHLVGTILLGSNQGMSSRLSIDLIVQLPRFRLYLLAWDELIKASHFLS